MRITATKARKLRVFHQYLRRMAKYDVEYPLQIYTYGATIRVRNEEELQKCISRSLVNIRKALYT